MSLELWQYGLLALLGVFMGFLNVLAGGGSFFSLPILIFLGLPAPVANGTNRLCLLTLYSMAITNFHRHGKLPFKPLLYTVPPAAIGALIGSHWILKVPDDIFNRLLAIMMLLILIFLNVKITFPHIFVRLASRPHVRNTLLVLAFFIVGLYGGSLQAGSGFIMIAALSLIGRFDMLTTSAIKGVVVMAYTLVAFANFVYHDKVIWPIAIALATGTALGGWISSHVALKKGHRWVKKVVSVCLFLMALKLLFY